VTDFSNIVNYFGGKLRHPVVELCQNVGNSSQKSQQQF